MKRMIHDYLDTFQKLAIAVHLGKTSEEQIFPLLSRFKELYPDWEELWDAEAAFHSGEFEGALQQYLKLAPFPYYPYFSYRAAAQIWEKRGEKKKATDLYQKALDLYPCDIYCLKRIRELSIDKKSVDNSIQIVVDQSLSNVFTPLNKSSQEKELKEIFREVDTPTSFL